MIKIRLHYLYISNKLYVHSLKKKNYVYNIYYLNLETKY